MNLGGHKHSVHNTNEDESEFCISFMLVTEGWGLYILGNTNSSLSTTKVQVVCQEVSEKSQEM